VYPDRRQRLDKHGRKVTHRLEDGQLVTDTVGA